MILVVVYIQTIVQFPRYHGVVRGNTYNTSNNEHTPAPKYRICVTTGTVVTRTKLRNPYRIYPSSNPFTQ